MNVKARAVKAHHAKNEEWLFGVRARITGLNPKISVAQIVCIFIYGSPTMDFFHRCYADGLSPDQTVTKLIDECGVQIIFLP